MAAAQETARGELTCTLTEQLTIFQNRGRQSERYRRAYHAHGRFGSTPAPIDKAQQEITALSGQVVELRKKSSTTNRRAAHLARRNWPILYATTPETAYAFQHTLSNGRRADCLIRLPKPPGPVVVDSKFPLEAYQRWRGAESDEAARAALENFRTDTQKHATDIAERYIIPAKRRMRH